MFADIRRHRSFCLLPTRIHAATLGRTPNFHTPPCVRSTRETPWPGLGYLVDLVSTKPPGTPGSGSSIPPFGGPNPRTKRPRSSSRQHTASAPGVRPVLFAPENTWLLMLLVFCKAKDLHPTKTIARKVPVAHVARSLARSRERPWKRRLLRRALATHGALRRGTDFPVGFRGERFNVWF